MKGMNRLELNSATVCDALQEYLDKRLTTAAGKQKVLGVTYTPHSAGSQIFSVLLEERKPA